MNPKDPRVRRAAMFVAGVIFLPGIALGQTTGDFQTRLGDLLRQLQLLQSQMRQTSAVVPPVASGSGNACSSITRNLRAGALGADVAVLHKLLVKEGFSVPADELAKQEFGKGTASSVSGFQERYRSEILAPAGLAAGNGFVGQGTRAKLTRLYPCATTLPVAGSTPAPGTPPAPSPTSSLNSGTLTVTLASASPAAQTLSAGSSAIKAGTFRLATGGPEIKIKGFTVTLSPGMSGICELRNLRLMDGGTQTGTQVQPNSFCSATFTGLNIPVSSAASKEIALLGDLSSANPAGQNYRAALQDISVEPAAARISGLPVLASLITVAGNPTGEPPATNIGGSGATTTTPAVKTLTVSRAPSSALGGSVPRQAVLDAATFQMTASAPLASDNIIVNSMVFRRVPVPSGGCDLSNASLVRASTGQTLANANFDSSCEAVFRNLSLFIAPATTETVTIRMNAVSAAGGSLAVHLTAMDSNALVTGLPVPGNNFIFALSDQNYSQMANVLHSLRGLLESISLGLR